MLCVNAPMPENCFRCFASHWYNFGGEAHGFRCRVINDNKLISNCEGRSQRRPDCPLQQKEESSALSMVEVEPVTHGTWEEYDCFCCNSDGEPVIKTGSVFICSVCGREEHKKEPYCHCGAKMDQAE